MSGYVVTTGSGHIDDGALVAIIDGELDPRTADAHLGVCEACRERLALFRDAAEKLRSSLAPVSVPQMRLPARRRFRWSYPAVAAASLFIVASVAAATPVANWIMQRFTNPPEAAPTPVDPVPAPSTSPGASGIIASFAATDTVLVIRIDQRQAGGAVHLVAASSDRISAQAVSGSAAEELMVLPAELRIANSEASTAEYRISVPSGVRVVRVLVAGGEVEAVRNHAGLDHRISFR